MSFKRKLFLVISAFMIGFSNVILEEDRMVNDTRDQIEHVQTIDDDKELE